MPGDGIECEAGEHSALSLGIPDSFTRVPHPIGGVWTPRRDRASRREFLENNRVYTVHLQ
jgi:hypothetical protein